MATFSGPRSAAVHGWAGVGSAGDADPFIAGRTAAERALAARPAGRATDCVIVFSGEGQAEEALLAGVAEQAAGAKLIGCSAPAALGPGAMVGRGAVVLTLGGGDHEVRTASAVSSPGEGPRRAARTVSVALRASAPCPPDLVLALTGATIGDQDEIVRGIYGEFGGAVPFVGGTTARYPSGEAAAQFHGSRVFSRAVVAASFHGFPAVSVAVRNGLVRAGEPLAVTRSEGTRIIELDGRPALDAYLDAFAAPAEAGEEADAFGAFALAHPLGVARTSGVDQARCVRTADFDSRQLDCVAAVPQGALVWPLRGTLESTVAAAGDAVGAALRGLGDRPPRAVLVIDCMGRRAQLGEAGGAQELAALDAAAAGVPWAGFYSYGEFARLQGVRGFHNKTIVAVAIA